MLSAKQQAVRGQCWLALGSKGKSRHPLETPTSKSRWGLCLRMSIMQRACTSCPGLAHTLIRLSYNVKQPACPDCQLGLLFHLVALVNEPMRGWRSSLWAIQGNRGPLLVLPQCPAFLLSPMFTLRMERELIPNQEKGGGQELRLQPDCTALDGSSDS